MGSRHGRIGSQCTFSDTEVLDLSARSGLRAILSIITIHISSNTGVQFYRERLDARDGETKSAMSMQIAEHIQNALRPYPISRVLCQPDQRPSS